MLHLFLCMFCVVSPSPSHNTSTGPMSFLGVPHPGQDGGFPDQVRMGGTPARSGQGYHRVPSPSWGGVPPR